MLKEMILFICWEGEEFAVDILPVYSQLRPAGEQNFLQGRWANLCLNNAVLIPVKPD